MAPIEILQEELDRIAGDCSARIIKLQQEMKLQLQKAVRKFVKRSVSIGIQCLCLFYA